MKHPHAEKLDAYWAKRFECLPTDFQKPGIVVVATEQMDPARIVVLETEQSTIIRGCPHHADQLADWIESWKPNSPRSADAIAKAVAHQEWKVGPPERVLYLDSQEFRPCPNPNVRQLSPNDSAALTAMHRGCSLKEQQAGEVNIDHPAIFGAFVDGKLVAAASFIDQGDGIFDVGVLVHRDFRRQGFGRAAVSALSQWGMEHDWIVQYWRLCANTGSARLADSLGFTDYGCYQTLHLSIAPFA